ncbi:MAG: XrtA/PEP-CTERM system histidine kinase PrsK [Candidatus Eisenbacteria bacterium]
MTAPPFQQAVVTASALLAAMIGILGTLRRGHWVTTLLFSSAFVAVAALQAGILGLLHADSATAARVWATYLLGVSALTAWLWLALSVVFARSDPMRHIQQAAAYLALALAGCLTLFSVAGTRYVVSDVHGLGGMTVLVLGGLGRVYLMYLVLVVVGVIMNLESTLRTAPASAQRRLRPLMLAFVIGAMAGLMFVSAGLLYGSVPVAWMTACSVPLFIAGVAAALSLARRRLSDMSIPAARPVVYYSSVSLTIAGLFLLTMAVLSKVLPVMTPEWKRAVGVAFYLVAGGGGLLLTISPGASRAIKRFIDKNFYANRYDYRREWERVSRAIAPTARPEELCRQIETLVRTVFDAERVVIHLRDDRTGEFVCVFRSGGAVTPPLDRSLAPDNPLVTSLTRLRHPLAFRDLAQDLDLIPAAAENREILEAVGAAVCAPLTVGDDLIGLLWLSGKRADEDYTGEDLEFLGAMTRQLAAALWFARLADQLAETRQLESLHRLSSYVLHDIKNQVSGLSLMIENSRRHMSDPEFQRDALKVVERTVRNLQQLMDHVAGVSRAPVVAPDRVSVDPLLARAAEAAGLVPGDNGGVLLRVERRGPDEALLDGEQMVRVVTNLLVNAREAIERHGDITLATACEDGDDDCRWWVLRVRDTGRGMHEDFVRRQLFRPFATTKPAGLGVGLAQSRAIVEAHGGSIRVDSRPGSGTVFEVRIPQRETRPPAAEVRA